MTYQSFELVFDYSDNRTQIIKHTEMGLYLKVVPEQLVKSTYGSTELTLIATFYGRGTGGKRLREHARQTHFQVLNLNSSKRELWDMALLKDAVDYYCHEHISKRYDELNLIMQGRTMRLGADDYHMD